LFWNETYIFLTTAGEDGQPVPSGEGEGREGELSVVIQNGGHGGSI